MKLFSPMEPSAACSYVATQRGGVALLFEGHRYNKVRDGKDGTVYWRCSRDRQCPGRAVTVNNRVKKSNNKHNHPPEASLLLRNGSSGGGGNGNAHHHSSANNNNNSLATNNSSSGGGSNSSASSAMAAAAAAAAAYASFLHGGNSSTSPHHQKSGHHQQQQQQHSPLLHGSRVQRSSPTTTTTTTSSSPSPLSGLGPLGLGPLSVPGGNAFSSAFNFLHNLAAASAAAGGGGDTGSSLDSPTGKTTSQVGSPPPHQTLPLSLTSPPTNSNHHHHPHYSQYHHHSQHHQSNNNNHSHNNNHQGGKAQYRNSFSSSSTTLDLSPSRSPFAFSGNDHHHQQQQQHYLHRNSSSSAALSSSSSSHSPSTSSRAQRMPKSASRGGYMKASPPSSPSHHLPLPLLQPPPLPLSQPPPPPSSSSSSSASQHLQQLEQQQQQQQTSLAAAFMLQDALQEAQVAAVAACAFPSLLTETFKYLAAAAATNPQMAAALAANLTAGANPALLKSLDLAAAVVGAGAVGGSDVNINNNGFGTSLRVLPDLENSSPRQHSLNLLHQHQPFVDDADCQPLNMALSDLRGGGCSILKMLRTVMRSGGSGGAASSAAAHHQHSSSSDSALQALVVPTADAHGSEYIAPCDARREYLTKFTGSAGTAVVTLKEAALWTDGRYFLQAVAEMDPASWVLMKDRLPGTATIGEWLNEVLAAEGGGARVGADPYTMSYEGWLRLERELAEGGNLLVATPANLVDAVWGSGRPARPSEPVLPLDIAFTGRRWQEKVEEVRGEMRAKGASLLVLTALDDVAWLLNLRGADIEYNPVFFAYAIVTLEKTVLFIEESKLTASALAHLQQPTDDPMDSLPASSTSSNSSSPNHSNRSTPNGANLDGSGKSAASEVVEIRPYELVADYIRSYIAQSSGSGSSNSNGRGRVWMSNKSSYALVNLIPESRRLLTGVSPVTSRKAIKNEVEIAGMRRAHIKDAVALCEFYAWLEDEVLHHHHHGKGGARKMSGSAGALSPSSNSSSSSSMSSAAPGGVDEMAVDAKLEEFRRQQDDYIGPSFPAISGSGPNGAIIHYQSTPETNRPITTEEMYLLDTGAQFRDGTTDITRTIHLGTPTPHERECFTRVLKGHISLATARFPRLVKGEFLDSFARRALWDVGLDYNHGTGHGVGSYLNVHEGPSGISNRVNADDPGVQEAMIYSNEPGYYEAGHFGVRLESLVVTKRVDLKYNFNDRGYLGFETITLVPIQTKLIDPSLMTAQEIEWIDAYHQQCRELVGKELEVQGRSRALQWLLKETQPIGQ